MVMLVGLSPKNYLYLASRQKAGAKRGPAQDWWNLPAKVDAAIRIRDEENDRHRGRNTPGDAQRHAEWSRRTALEAGPVFSTIAGIAHEVDNLLSNDGPISESIMDLTNNSEGVAAAKAGRPVDASKLQNSPISYGVMAGRQSDQYEDTTPDRKVYPSRPDGDYGTPKGGYKDGPARKRPEDRYPAY